MLENYKNYSPQKIRGITWPITAKIKQEKEKEKGGEKEALDVHCVHRLDGWVI